jgi:hypothetical protein
MSLCVFLITCLIVFPIPTLIIAGIIAALVFVLFIILQWIQIFCYIFS